jgi:hypothetical protein
MPADEMLSPIRFASTSPGRQRNQQIERTRLPRRVLRNLTFVAWSMMLPLPDYVPQWLNGPLRPSRFTLLKDSHRANGPARFPAISRNLRDRGKGSFPSAFFMIREAW